MCLVQHSLSGVLAVGNDVESGLGSNQTFLIGSILVRLD